MAEKNLRAFTWTNPSRWDCPANAKGLREAREIVAAWSKTEAASLFAKGGSRVLPRDTREDATAAEKALALGSPGSVFWRPLAASDERYVQRGEPWADVVWVEGLAEDFAIEVLNLEIERLTRARDTLLRARPPGAKTP